MSEYLDEVNKTKVTAKLLAEVLEAFADMPSEQRTVYEARAFRMFTLLKAKGFGERKIAALCIAIDFRLQALAQFRDDPAYRAWARPSTEPGADTIHYDLLRVAAVLPLQNDGPNRVRFDAETFRARLLSTSGTEGAA